MKASLSALACAALIALCPAAGAAQNGERTVSLFQFDGASGYAPQGGVITDRQGTVFGATTIGGTGPCIAGAGCGTVYALTPPPGGVRGKWTLNVLYNFKGGQDGAAPSEQLTLGPDGALYGYTADGTPGTVFRLLPPTVPGNPWQFQILYVFTGKADGNLSVVGSPLVWRRGVLYGVASGGSGACGQFGCGSVFRISLHGGVGFLKTLYRFTGEGGLGEPNWIVGPSDGSAVYVSTTLGLGAVVQLSPPLANGQWSAQVIARFKPDGQGEHPGNLVVGPDGALFGLVSLDRAGAAFQLTPPAQAGSPWTRTLLASISDHRYGPVSLALGGNGSLVGAIVGDVDFFAGAIFKLTPPVSGGAWTYSQVKNFDFGPDRNPINVVTGRRGDLYTVLDGGDSSSGSLVLVPF